MAQKKKTGHPAAEIATALGALGAYWFLASKGAPQHRKAAQGWMSRARTDLAKTLKSARNVDKETYMQLAKNVVDRYAAVGGMTGAEIARATKDLQTSWVEASKPTKKAAKKKTAARKKKA